MPDFTRPEPTFETVTEKVWALVRAGDGDALYAAYATEEAAEEAEQSDRNLPWGANVVEVTLHRQSLRPVYGGGTLIENLWAEMDRLMEGLMTGQEAEGDRYRAEELAYVLAIVTNAYDPSIDRIRAEALERWNAAEREAALQEEALDPDQDEMMTRPEGADQ